MGSRSMREMPAFLRKRFEAYRDVRVARDWGGRNIFCSRLARSDDLVLMSNDYLAISSHPKLIERQCEALRSHGLGVMMSPIYVENEASPAAERAIAKAVGFGEGIFTQSGYAANVGLIEALAGMDVPVYIDQRAHASMHMGVRSAKAKSMVFPHNDVPHLAASIREHGPGVIAIDSLYSAEGDIAPLSAIAEVSISNECVLVVDESHALGVYGTSGEGLVASLALTDQVDFITASLAKAYCCRAGYIASPEDFRSYFGIHSMPAIFSSTLLPHDAASIAAAHEVVVQEAWRRDRLFEIVGAVRKALCRLGYPVASSGSQIVSLEVGTDAAAARVRDVLMGHGIFAALFTPPATPRNRSLVRLSLHAGLTDENVSCVVYAFGARHAELAPQAWSSRSAHLH
ncbi:MAG: alpha-hydroxyketone-type quorum-sensing autoinducer synthase [Luteibacter sp.]